MARSSFQKLHKAFQDHAVAQERQRKAHDSQLYTIGRAHEDAGLFDLDEATRKGMLACCAEELPKMRDKWTARGVKLSEANESPVTSPARALFPRSVMLSKQARTALAAEGLKEIRKLDIKLGYGLSPDDQLWSGHVLDYARARAVVSELGGKLELLGPAGLKEAAE